MINKPVLLGLYAHVAQQNTNDKDMQLETHLPVASAQVRRFGFQSLTYNSKFDH